MQRDDVRKVVTAQFYQSLADGGVQIDALPQAQLQALANALADGLVAALAALEEEEVNMAAPTGATPQAAQGAEAGADGEEQLLWRGRPYLSIGLLYELTTQRLRIIRGLLGRSAEEIELVRVRDTSVSQHMGERALNIGDITIVSNDPNQPKVVLHNVGDPISVREKIRTAALEEKARRKLAYREEM